MLYTVAKRYSKAILQSWSFEELEGLLEKLRILEGGLKHARLIEILQSPYVAFDDKKTWLLGFFDSQDKRIEHLITLMLQNKRMDTLPYLCLILQNHLNEKNKTYQGVIYAKELLQDQALNTIRNNLARHLGVELDLLCKQTQKDEISLVVEGLGIEISFSNERFLEDLKNYILQAI